MLPHVIFLPFASGTFLPQPASLVRLIKGAGLFLISLIVCGRLKRRGLTPQAPEVQARLRGYDGELIPAPTSWVKSCISQIKC